MLFKSNQKGVLLIVTSLGCLAFDSLTLESCSHIHLQEEGGVELCTNKHNLTTSLEANPGPVCNFNNSDVET